MPYEDDYKMWLEKMLIESNPDWLCDGMCDVEFTHEWCGKHCGKDSDYVTPKCLHMYYHHVATADRKPEPQYDAEEAAKDINRRVDLIKREWEVRHKDEPQPNADQHVQHIGSVETMSCQECLWCADGQETCANPSLCVYKPKDEPQTDCAWK